MLQGKDIIFWAGFPFDKSAIEGYLSKTLAKNNRIFYVEYPESLIRAFYHKDFSVWWKFLLKAVRFQRLQNPYPNVIVYVLRKIPFLFITYPDWLRRIIIRWNIWYVKKYLNRIGFNKPIVVVFYPTAIEVLHAIEKEIGIYYCVEDYTLLPHYKLFPKRRKHIESLEKKILKKADISLFVSEDLAERKKMYCQRSDILKTGIDIHRFQVESFPYIKVKNKRIFEPIIGFIGGINERIDWNLMESVSQKCREYSFVFIGSGCSITASRKRISNFYFLGEVDPKDAPRYIIKFNIGIVPYVINSFTTVINPTKMYEYLAAGIPIVSTPLPTIVNLAQETGEGVYYIADSSEKFALAIRQALIEDDMQKREKRKLIALSNRWEVRAEEFSKIVMECKQSDLK